MNTLRSCLIINLGLFALVGQTLLFREFLVAFEGNELGVGAFFGSWFVWIAVGAVLVYRTSRAGRVLIPYFDVLVCLYIPAFLLQFFLILHSRSIIGIDPYQLFNFSHMTLAAFIVNAPLSLLTGIFFPLACRWIEREGRLPVSRVYLLESVGSLLGGLGTTYCLSRGISAPPIFLAAGLLLAGSSILLVLGSPRRRFWAVIPVLLTVGMVWPGGGQAWKQVTAQTKWDALLPGASLEGVFQTPQAEYLYGHYWDQFLVASHGRVIETLPNRESAAEIAALHLCQQPNARRIFIAGSNLFALARSFLPLAQTDEVALCSSDPDYLAKLMGLVPDRELLNEPRLHLVEEDIRAHLQENPKHYDLIILNLPEATTVVLNRYRTVEFYQAVQKALTPEGVAGVYLPGGENVLGTELVELGASTLATLQEVFPYTAIKPGQATWFLVNHTGQISEWPVILHDRYQRIPGAENIFPAVGLFSLYPPDRIDFARQLYEKHTLPKTRLINHDVRPLGQFYGLLLFGKHSKSLFTRLIRHISYVGFPFFLLPLGVLVLLRIVYLFFRPSPENRSPKDGSIFLSKFLIFSAGLVSIGTEILLMYLLQIRYGSLYLYIGLIGSLFMLGLTLGAAFTRTLMLRTSVSRRFVCLIILICHLALIYLASRLGGSWQFGGLIPAFILSGLLTGGYFPLAARTLEEWGITAQHAGGNLDLLDHLGAALGAVLTGIGLIPILGIYGTWGILGILMAINIIFLILESVRPSRLLFQSPTPGIGASDVPFRKWGYLGVGIALWLIGASHLIQRASQAQIPHLTQAQAAQLAAGEHLLAKEFQMGASAEKLVYFEIRDNESTPKGYIFRSKPLAGRIRGYGGPIDLLIRVDLQGGLERFLILTSYETPSYLELMKDWPPTLEGKNIFHPNSLSDIDAVSGATITCDAVKAILEQAGVRFSREVLGLHSRDTGAPELSRLKKSYDLPGLLLGISLVLVIPVSRWGNRWGRRIFLIAVFVVGGCWANLQYSTAHVFTILSGQWPNLSLGHNVMLVLAVPVFVLLFGNLYCGYLCPFGALQEILSFIWPRRWRVSLDRVSLQWGRTAKYLVLLVLVVLFFLSWNRDILHIDILTRAFTGTWPLRYGILLGLVLLVSLFITRFWCRNLCPAGAFLALLGSRAIFRRALPRKRYLHCDLGVHNSRELDCICCDRCRFEITSGPACPTDISSTRKRVFLIVVFLLVGFLIQSTGRTFFSRIRSEPFFQPTGAPSTGQSREVDPDLIRQHIREGRLSDHEADYYHPLPPDRSGK